MPRKLQRRLQAAADAAGVTRSSVVRALVTSFVERVENEGLNAIPLVFIARHVVAPTDEYDAKLEARRQARLVREMAEEQDTAYEDAAELAPDAAEDRRATLARLWREAGMSDEDVARALADDDAL